MAQLAKMLTQGRSRRHRPVAPIQPIHVDWQGDVRDSQVAIGNGIIQIHAERGAKVISYPVRPRTRHRPRPVRLFELSDSDMLDRRDQSSAALTALQLGRPVEVVGPVGIGKTTLLGHLAHDPNVPSLPGGIVALAVPGKGYNAIIQDLFHAFYTTNLPYQPTVIDAISLLQREQAVIMLDDVHLTRDEAGRLRAAAPGCRFVLSSQERALFGKDQSIELPGLPFDVALELIEQELHRPLTEAEKPSAHELWSILDDGRPGHPWHLLLAVALLHRRGSSLADFVGMLKTSSPEQVLGTAMLADLTSEERKVVDTLAALRGASLMPDELAAVTKVHRAGEVAEDLVQRHILRKHGDRYAVTSVVGEITRRALRLAGEFSSLMEGLLLHFAQWATQHKEAPIPTQIQENADAIMSVLQWAIATGRWEQSVALGRAVEAALMLGEQWAVWAQTLHWIYQAALALHEPAAEAWALHQLGTRALCLGDKAAAHEKLSRALRIRESLHDTAGAAVTRHNLSFLLAPVPPRETHTNDTPPPPPPRGLHWFVLALLPILLIISTWPVPHGPHVSIVGGNKLEFGSQEVDSSSTAKVKSIENDGHTDLIIKAVHIEGTNPDDFGKQTDTCSGRTIQPGKQCEISVSFAPHAAGARHAIVSIVDNADGSPHQIILGGNGVIPKLEIAPASVAFGKVQLGQTREQTIELTSTGTSDLTITSIEVNGADGGAFHLAGQACIASRLAPGAQCGIQVSFAPQAIGEHQAQLRFTDNAADSPQVVTLSGIGVGPDGRLSATHLDFDTVKIGKMQDKSVSLFSTGTEDLVVSAIVLEGAGAADFKADGCSGKSLPPGTQCTITVHFAPHALDKRTAILSIADTAARSPQRVMLSGVGKGVPQLQIDPSPLDFGSVQQRQTPQDKTLHLTSTGSADLNIASIKLSGAEAGDFTILMDTCSKKRLAPGQQCKIQVRFAPRSSGTRTASLAISDDTDDSPHNVGLQGIGVHVLDMLRVTPENPSVPQGRVQPFTSTGTYSDGITQPLTSVVSWTTSDAAVATIGADGVARSMAQGTVTITAMLDNSHSASATLTVTPPVLETITVSPGKPCLTPTPPNPDTPSPPTTQAFTAEGTYSNGEKKPLTRGVMWSSSNPAIATIDANTGMATAQSFPFNTPCFQQDRSNVTVISATYKEGDHVVIGSTELSTHDVVG